MTSRFSIFIIDDELDLCRELRGWFEAAGYAVACHAPRRTTLASLVAAPPGLLILGVTTAGGDGLTFHQRLSTHRQLRQVPVIAVADDPGLEYELLDVYDFQALPLDRKRLLITVARLAEAAAEQRPPLLSHLPVEQLEPFRQLLLERSGLHFSSSNLRLLERGLLHRMQARQVADPARYLNYLQRPGDNQDELNKLLGLLTVGETCFFRYRTHREALVRQVLPELISQAASRRRLRIWSAGCSTGEEPYSLALMLVENFPELAEWDVQILATDINKRSLRQARDGIYRSHALRQVEESLRQRHFRQSGNSFVLDRGIRNLVRFAYLNLQGDPFPAAENGTRGLDLIFCRNVLIYFQSATMREIVARFADCLNPGGFLFLGHSETLQSVSDRFQRHHQHGAFYYQIKPVDAHRPVTRSLPVCPPAPPALPDTPPQKNVRPALQVSSPPAPLPAPPAAVDIEGQFAAAMAAFDREDFAAAEQLFDCLLEEAPEFSRALAGKGMIFANQGRYDEARQICARAIRFDDLCPEAYLLRGLILDMEEQPERALVEYQKVLWLDRSLVMAHYLSSRVHARLGQRELQRRALRNTIRCLEKLSAARVITFSGGLSQAVFLEICRRELLAIS